MELIGGWPTWPLISVLLGLMFLTDEIGFRVGRARHRHEAETSRTVSNALKASIFGLVAFLLAFAFSMTANRHDARRQVVLDEANAIGTCYLRAELLDAPFQNRLRDTLQRFVAVRLEYFDQGLDPTKVKTLTKEMDRLLDDLWLTVSDATKANPQQVHTSQIISATNLVIDLNTTRQWATSSHLQPIVLILLLACVLVSSLLIGHSSGQAGQRHSGLWAAFNVLFALLLFVVIDFDRPRRGLIQVDHRPLVDLQEMMQRTPSE